jgi:hypothetical protein
MVPYSMTYSLLGTVLPFISGDVHEDVTSGGLSGDRANRVRNGGQTEASMMQGWCPIV